MLFTVHWADFWVDALWDLWRQECQRWSGAEVGNAVGRRCIGGCIGYLVVSVDAIRDRAFRIARLASYGVVLGAVGGAIGMFVGDEVNFVLNNTLSVGDDESTGAIVAMFARGLGWTILGVAIGMSEGIAAKSLGKFSYGTIGGTIGGFFGGCLFGLILLHLCPRSDDLESMGQRTGPGHSRCLYWIVFGLGTRGFSARIRQGAAGWQEGREYPLDKPSSLLGRDEHADITPFRDMNVEKKHAIVTLRDGPKYVLVNNGAPPNSHWSTIHPFLILRNSTMVTASSSATCCYVSRPVRQ